jgi:hypothetical protein
MKIFSRKSLLKEYNNKNNRNRIYFILNTYSYSELIIIKIENLCCIQSINVEDS